MSEDQDGEKRLLLEYLPMELRDRVKDRGEHDVREFIKLYTIGLNERRAQEGRVMDEEDEGRTIGTIGNYYGSLHVKEEDGKFSWSIENFSGHSWEEIPESLYRELIAFDDAAKKREG